MELDSLDRRILTLFSHHPKVGVLEASRRLGAARGTVQSRLDRLQSEGVISSWAPTIDPTAVGYPVTAFLTLEIRQGVGHDRVAEHLTEIPEVIEVCTITGSGDLWCRVVARSNSDLQRVIDDVVNGPGTERCTTVISLATQIAPRVLPLLNADPSLVSR